MKRELHNINNETNDTLKKLKSYKRKTEIGLGLEVGLPWIGVLKVGKSVVYLVLELFDNRTEHE